MTGAWFWPMFAQVVLTFVVWVTMYRRRVAEMRANRINPQLVAQSHGKAELLKDTRASDNFSNLFEMPVLFFAACIVVGASGIDSPFLLLLAWAFVILRACHSVVQITYNRVVHRFLIYVTSSFVVFAMWVITAIELL